MADLLQSELIKLRAMEPEDYILIITLTIEIVF